MAHQEVPGIAAVHSPAGAFAAAPASRSVKPEAADDHEDVSILGINGNPVPGAFLPVIQESLEWRVDVSRPASFSTKEVLPEQS